MLVALKRYQLVAILICFKYSRMKSSVDVGYFYEN